MSFGELQVCDGESRSGNGKALLVYEDHRTIPPTVEVMGTISPEFELRESSATNIRETRVLAQIFTAQVQAAVDKVKAPTEEVKCSTGLTTVKDSRKLPSECED